MNINFENTHEYIEYLENSGRITRGCALCMTQYGVCEHASGKYASADEGFIVCEPFGDIGLQQFPESCLREWYGEEYLENIDKEEY